MNATNLITVFGLDFDSAARALLTMGFKHADAEIRRAIWVQGAQYWEQPCTLRTVCGDVVLVRNLLLPESSVLDTETLPGFYIVEARTLRGEPNLYSVRFTQHEDGPAEETWAELPKDSARSVMAIDEEGDSRIVVLARTEDGTLFVAVTSPENARAFRDYASAVLCEAQKSAALNDLQF